MPTPKKNKSKPVEDPKSSFIKAFYELIGDKIQKFLTYEEKHLFDLEEIEKILSRNIDQRIAKMQSQKNEDTITRRRARKEGKSATPRQPKL